MKINLMRSAFILILGFSLGIVSCNQAENRASEDESIKQVKHPSWSTDASIYEVNIRQFTEEGTFEALEAHLPRLKELGTEILWLMPIHPIGEVNRKGTLGSYYSVKDYKGINPEFGDSISFKRFVKKAHEHGLYVIIDWVANHSAWDNYLVNEHPDWYVKDSLGDLVSPFDWTDVVKFNFDVPEMRQYMLDAMKYWVASYDIDGYRCDVAGEVPMDFWDNARQELDKIKPVFMLAEAEGPEFHSAFDMTYAWEFHHIMNNVYKGVSSANDIENYLNKDKSLYPEDAYRMNFITNHDENSWNGTEFERLGPAVETFFALATVVPGMPLIYTGQEAGLNKRLEFFEKDAVEWGDYPMTAFYKSMIAFKTLHPALHNGTDGGDWRRVKTNDDAKIFAISREKGTNQVLAVFNLSNEEVTVAMSEKELEHELETLFTNETIYVDKFTRIKLPPWQYKILYR